MDTWHELDLVVDAAPDPLLVLTTAGRVVRANAAWQRVLGWAAGDLRDHGLADLIHPDDLGAALAAVRQLAGGDADAVTGLRSRCRSRAGGYRWLEWNGTRLRGPGLLIATARDVTETVALEASAARLHTTIAVQRGITEVAADRDAVLRLMADRSLQVVPAGDTAVVGLVDDRDGATLWPVAAAGRRADRSLLGSPLTGSLPDLALSGGHTLRTDELAADPRGSREPGAAAGSRSLVVAPILAGDGRALGVLMVGSERPGAFDEGDEQQLTLLAHALGGALQHAEDAARNEELLHRANGAVEKLTRSERRFVSLFGNSPVANILVGLRGPQRGRIVLANPAFSELLGYPANQVIGRHLAELVPPEHVDDVERTLSTLAAGTGREGNRPGVLRESVLRHRDGNDLLVSSHTSVILDEDGATRAMFQVLDITAARRAETELARLLAERTETLTALQVSEARFRLTFDGSPLGVTLLDLAPETFGRYLAANAAMTRITGWSSDELAGMTFRDLVHPDDLPAVSDVVARLAGDPAEPARHEYRYRHRDGGDVWVAVSTGAVHDRHHRPLYLVDQVEDITARRQNEAQLRRQARLLELIPAAVIVRDLDGTIRWWNAGAAELYGRPAAEVLGKEIHRLLATVFPDGMTAGDLEDTLRRAGAWNGPLDHVTADGRTVTVLSRQALHQPAGTPDADVQVLEINADVTASRHAERALAASEQRFRAQFSNSAAGQVVRALDGTFIDVNPAYAAMVGYPAEVLIGMSDRELLDAGDLAAGQDLVAELFADADTFTHETRLRHALGHWIDVAATMSLVRDADGRPQHVIGVVTDVTDRRIAERARDQAAEEFARRNDELEAADQLKFDIIAMLGHEIGNPLSSIRGYSEVLLEDWAHLDDARRDSAITAIARQAGRLDEIVQEVLAMVTLDAGMVVSDRRELSLREHVDIVLSSTGSRQVPVLGEDRRVVFSPGHLQQILVNLLSNAAKYAGGATAVRIVRDPRDPATVHLRVEDEGAGVPEEFRHRLFERLARAARDARTVRGTGLGLYIVRGLARANGGDVHHEPGPIGGSHFVLDLPAAPG
jgi:PAS domain S-box-containing protein